MKRDDYICPKCRAKMELGHFIDFTDSGCWPSMWVKDIDVAHSVCRELCLLKIHAPKESQKSQVIQYTDVFRGRIVDVSHDTVGVEITGDKEKIDAFIELVKGLGIKVVARTGLTAMERG